VVSLSPLPPSHSVFSRMRVAPHRKQQARDRDAEQQATHSVSQVQKRSSISRFRMAKLGLQFENLVGRAPEYTRERQCQRQAGHVAVAFDRIDALPGHADRLRKLLLGPPFVLAEIFDAVQHGGCHDKWSSSKADLSFCQVSLLLCLKANPARQQVPRVELIRHRSTSMQKKRNTMRFLMLLKADKTTEAGVLPSRADVERQGDVPERESGRHGRSVR
jgi:hypothetical protein